MPRPGSQVIPAGWSAHHQPVAEGTMTARCTIDRAGDGPPVWNDDTGAYDPIPRVVLHADVPCRIQQWKQPLVADVGQQELTTHHYLIPVPVYITDVAVGQQVLVTTNPDDPSLVGRRLDITDVQRGSLAWERDLVCLDHLG
jgi:hypothetical protein